MVVKGATGNTISVGKLGEGRMTLDLAQMKAGGSSAGVTQGCLPGLAVQGVSPIGEGWTLRIGSREFDVPRDQGDNLRLVLG